MNCFPLIDALPSLTFIEPVTARVAAPNLKLLALLAKPTALTSAEWAFLEMVEQEAGREAVG